MQRLSVEPMVKVLTILIMFMAMIFSIALTMYLWDVSKKVLLNSHKIIVKILKK
jgi:hypothetical protein